jgi:transcriptional regulator with XRE-family HTH domain
MTGLRAARQAAGKSLRTVAEAAGVDRGNLSRAERGQSSLSVPALASVLEAIGDEQTASALRGYLAPTD